MAATPAASDCTTANLQHQVEIRANHRRVHTPHNTWPVKDLRQTLAFVLERVAAPPGYGDPLPPTFTARHDESRLMFQRIPSMQYGENTPATIPSHLLATRAPAAPRLSVANTLIF